MKHTETLNYLQNIKSIRGLKTLRRLYNECVENNQSLIETLDSADIIGHYELNELSVHKEIEVHIGRVCGVCGLAPLERDVLIKHYQTILTRFYNVHQKVLSL